MNFPALLDSNHRHQIFYRFQIFSDYFLSIHSSKSNIFLINFLLGSVCRIDRGISSSEESVAGMIIYFMLLRIPCKYYFWKRVILILWIRFFTFKIRNPYCDHFSMKQLWLHIYNKYAMLFQILSLHDVSYMEQSVFQCFFYEF